MSAQLLTALFAGVAFVVASLLAFVAVVLAATAVSKRREAAGGQASADGLAQRAGALLVEMDGVLDSSSQDAGFADAEFGDAAARPYREAVERAREVVADAFRQHQLVSDGIAASDQERRVVLAEVVRRCEDAAAELEAHAARFEELRACAKHAPEVAQGIADAIAECAPRIELAEATLGRMRTASAASALASIERAPEDARERLRRASAYVDEGRAAIRAGDASAAAGALVRAREAADEADRLLDAVDKTAEGLEASRFRLTVGLTELPRPNGGF